VEAILASSQNARPFQPVFMLLSALALMCVRGLASLVAYDSHGLARGHIGINP